jgi:integrase
LHSVGAAEITLAHVASRLSAISRTNGTVTAGRCRSALSTMYRWAMGEGLLGASPVNPVVSTNRPMDSIPRDRVLSDPELAAIWNACDDDDYGKIVRLLILSGCRREEVGGLRWSEVNTDQGTMTLPRERVKNGHSLCLPLPPLALSIISSIPRRVSRDYLFGARGPGFCSWARFKSRLDARLGDQVAEWRLHDLRRTMRSGLGRLAIPPHIAELTIGHARRGIEAVYDRYSYQAEIGAALERWAAHVEAITTGTTPKVVPLMTLRA